MQTTLTMNDTESLFDDIGARLDTATVDVWHDGGCEYYNGYCGVVADECGDGYTVRGYYNSDRASVTLTGWTASEIAQWFVQATINGENAAEG